VVAVLRLDVRSFNHWVALSLLERVSASARLRGVSLTESSASVDRGGDPALLDALLDAVRNDPSVNVRLAAIDALSSRAGRAPVRSQLLAAFAAESSPLVQAAIADTVLAADGAAARRDLAQAVRGAKLDPKLQDYLARRLREEA
jgi:predicted Zn-dependent protease